MQVHLVAAGIEYGGWVFAAALAAAQMVQAKVGDDPVEPGVEGALEPEVAEVAVGLEEGLLVNVLGVLLVAQHVQREAEDGLVVAADQRVEGGAVAALSFADEFVVFGALLGAGIELRLRQLAAVAWFCPCCAAAFGIVGDDSIVPSVAAHELAVASRSAVIRAAGAKVVALRLRALPATADSAGASSPPASRLKASAFIFPTPESGNGSC